MDFLVCSFKALSEEIEKKDNLLIHLMNEKTTLEEEKHVRAQITEQELQDKLEMMSGQDLILIL